MLGFFGQPLTDPIFLFNPEKFPNREELISWKLDLRYPEIDKLREKLVEIKKDFYSLLKEVEKYNFGTNYIKIQYLERFKDFYKVIRIIECFYDEEEYEKYNLINEYFWINFELLDRVFEDKEFFTNELDKFKWILTEKQKKYFENTYIKADKIKYYFEEALKYLKLENKWKVEIWDAISIWHRDFNEWWWKILIPKEKEITLKRLFSLIAHEIDGHSVQFSSCEWLFSWSIRFSKSESLVEWFALYLEYMIESYLFWKTTFLYRTYILNYTRFSLLKRTLSIEEFLNKYKSFEFRNFRWFKDIERYLNLKDFVYIQGLYEVIKYQNIYSNFWDMIKCWAVNENHIKKYWVICWRKNRIKIKESSAYFILKNYF